jgi:predicted RNA-binding protein YlxR (DUF448 family)
VAPESRARTPQRTCVGCRRVAGVDRLVRLARDRDGAVRVGRGAPGRGAWVCGPDCLDRAVARGALARALRGEVRSGDLGAARATLKG